jgi:NAD(P)-dependent dehydrogenase (short-subunit alcohol dehydrogenase family)
MEVKDATVVVTGASSGLGRATAHAFAARGARLVLAARHGEELEEVAEACRRLGADALALPTDVTEPDAVDELAEAAVRAHGRLDVWINNAGVTYFAPLDEGSVHEHRGVIDANVLGCLHGARAAVPIFKRQGWGVLINVSSILGKVGHPFVPSYVVSKFAVRGLTEALRASLADDPDIHVCTILPFAIDTPHFLGADREIPRRPRPIPPSQDPEKVARAILGLVKHPRHERHVPSYMQLAVLLKRLFPATTDAVLLHVLQQYHLGPPEAPQRENVFQPERILGQTHGRGEDEPRLSAVLAFAARDAIQLVWRRANRRLRRARTILVSA